MESHLSCIPCFLNQAIEALDLTRADRDTRIRTMKKLLEFLLAVDQKKTPPELSMHLHAIIREETGDPDPYRSVKNHSAQSVRELLPQLQKLMNGAEDPLSLAVKLGVIGNVIDFGTPTRMDISEMIQHVVGNELDINDIQLFKQELTNARKILFLGDNAGEIILDTFLLSELKSMGKEIIYAVREGPIINDATYEDAMDAGIQSYAEIITSGSHGPGTLLSYASRDLITALRQADIIIAKGQGNFESLSADKRLRELTKTGTSIFFLLTVKCSIVAEYADVPQGGTIFKMYRL